MTALNKPQVDPHSDLELAAAIGRRDGAALRLVMRRNDQRLLRTAWRILRNREDAEDAVQSAYLNAFAGIGGFAGRSSLSTWLTRIVTNTALAHARGIRRRREWLDGTLTTTLEDYIEKLMRGSTPASPERALACQQIRQMIDHAINQLPAPFRAVFVLRQIEELDVTEVAETLGIPTATVKTRYLRARKRLQRALGPEFSGSLSRMFPFDSALHEQSIPISHLALSEADFGAQDAIASS